MSFVAHGPVVLTGWSIGPSLFIKVSKKKDFFRCSNALAITMHPFCNFIIS